MRTVAEEILGYRVILASDGETAVKLAAELQPALILMDLMMPVLDGFEAIQRLKSDEKTAAIPVIAITALGRTTDRQRALDIGASGYVSKPFDLDELAKTLRRYTSG
jgi:CheY-like chemotaxis protein